MMGTMAKYYGKNNSIITSSFSSDCGFPSELCGLRKTNIVVNYLMPLSFEVSFLYDELIHMK